VQLAAERSLVDANYEIAATKSQIALAQSILDYPALAKTAPAKAASAWSALVERWTIGCQIAPLKPLTPEQFAASAMQATGMLASITANLKKAQTTEPKKGSEQVEQLVSPQMVQLTLLNQLRPTFTEFVKHYGGLPGEDFQATVNQALFFGNGSVIDGWLKRGNIVGLALIDETDKLADEMSCSVFSRPASETEKASVAAYLKDRAGDRDVAITEMYWAMLSSSEFRFNH
jgi:hypothetical protein